MAKKVIRPLRSEADYETAVDEIEEYFDHPPTPGSAGADRFDLLTLIVEDFERTHWPIDPPDPIDAIRYGMETREANPSIPRAAAWVSAARIGYSRAAAAAHHADGVEAPPRLGDSGRGAYGPGRSPARRVMRG
jgi:hypothetical protein